MKRFLLILAVILVVGCIALVQNRRLTELRADNAKLRQQSHGEHALEESSRVAVSASVGVSDEAVAEVHETMVGMIVAFRGGRRGQGGLDETELAERRKRMLLAAKDFSAANIEALIAALLEDERLGELTADQRIEVCFELFGEVAPKAFLDYLEAHRDLADWQQRFDRCFREWLRISPQEAMARFEEESGNPDFETTSSRQSAMLGLAASDPDRMLELAMSPEYAADPDALAHLGGFVDDKFDTPADHLRFMTALRRAEAKDGDSPLLATIRKDYVREMSNQLTQWPIEDVRTLVDGEFTTEEKCLVAASASHRGDLEDRGAWADWCLGLDPASWDQWVSGQPNRFKHPVVGMVTNWARDDPEASAKWLEKVPPGELRSETVREYAWTIASQAPELAAGYLDELPEGKAKKRLVRKIEEAKE
ncbi:hypothetical protein [Haloferula sp.]|uniref:hypothetical protein n=1 Tax=Haloferula sp. TaxID=2497595 RepID=UPI00329B7262